MSRPNDAPDSDDSPADSWQHAKRLAVVETLNGLISARQVGRAELAQRLGWKPARLTRALSGKENLSLNTIAQLAAALGVDFDLTICDGEHPSDEADAGMARHRTPDWHQYIAPFGRFVGLAVGIGGLVYLVLTLFAAEAVSPLLGALLGAALFVLARAQWQLWLARREIRALKRYLKNRRANDS